LPVTKGLLERSPLASVLVTTECAQRKSGAYSAFRFVHAAYIAQCVGPLGQHFAQDFALAALLKVPMYRLAIRLGLRHQVPLGPGN